MSNSRDFETPSASTSSASRPAEKTPASVSQKSGGPGKATAIPFRQQVSARQGQGRDDLPFEPLTAPRIGNIAPATAEPVRWFQHVESGASKPPTLPTSAPDSVSHSGGNGANRARGMQFQDVADIARQELHYQRNGPPEPPDIILLRAKAIEDARHLMEEATRRADSVTQEASERGFAEGHAKGFVEGRREATALVTQQAEDDRAIYRADVEAFVLHVEAERQKAWAAMEPQVIGMVFELAKQVIKQEVEVSQEVALSVVRNALRRATDSASLRVRVSPDDLETVRGSRDDLLTLVDGIRHIEIVADRRVGSGGCVVETGAGNIDARLETQIETVGGALEQLIQDRETPV